MNTVRLFRTAVIAATLLTANAAFAALPQSYPQPVQDAFRQAAAGGQVLRVLNVGNDYVGTVITRDGRLIDLRSTRAGVVKMRSDQR